MRRNEQIKERVKIAANGRALPDRYLNSPRARSNAFDMPHIGGSHTLSEGYRHATREVQLVSACDNTVGNHCIDQHMRSLAEQCGILGLVRTGTSALRKAPL